MSIMNATQNMYEFLVCYGAFTSVSHAKICLHNTDTWNVILDKIANRHGFGDCLSDKRYETVIKYHFIELCDEIKQMFK